MKVLGTFLFHPHGRLKSFRWSGGRGEKKKADKTNGGWRSRSARFTWTADGVNWRRRDQRAPSTSQEQEHSREQKTRTDIFTIAGLAFARSGLPIGTRRFETWQINIVSEGAATAITAGGKITCENHFSASLRFHHWNLSSNPKLCSILWTLWSTGMTLLGRNLLFATPPLLVLTRNREFKKKK